MTDAILALHQGKPDDYRILEEQETKLLMLIMLKERESSQELMMTAAEFEEDFAKHGELRDLLAIFIRRLAVFAPKLKFDIGAIIYMLHACRNPGEAVMWAYTLTQITHEFGPLRLGEILEKTRLGDGLPKEEFLERCWHSQKKRDENGKRTGGLSDNRLDEPQAWAAPEAAV